MTYRQKILNLKVAYRASCYNWNTLDQDPRYIVHLDGRCVGMGRTRHKAWKMAWDYAQKQAEQEMMEKLKS